MKNISLLLPGYEQNDEQNIFTAEFLDGRTYGLSVASEFATITSPDSDLARKIHLEAGE